MFRILLLAVCLIAWAHLTKRAAAHHPHAHGKKAFTYSNPHEWSVEHPKCGGKHQSPIDMPSADMPAAPHHVIHAPLGPIELSSTGCSVAAAAAVSYTRENAMSVFETPEMDDAPWCTLRSPRTQRRYRFAQLHFHNTSEHTFGGERRDACIHLVWSAHDDASSLLVIEVSLKHQHSFDAGNVGDDGAPNFTVSSPSLFIDSILLPSDSLVSSKKNATEYHDTLQSLRLDSLFPSTKAYWHYSGSLTTPPCSEGVEWYVFRDASPISIESLQRYTSSMHGIHPNFAEEGNARPPQPINGRTIYYVSNEPESVADEGSSSFEAEWVIMGALMLGAAAAVAWTERKAAPRFSSLSS